MLPARDSLRSQDDVHREELPINSSILIRLMEMSTQSDLGMFIILLAVLKVLIFRYTGNENVIVITPIYKPLESVETINEYV